MILSDYTIADKVSHGDIDIEPMPSANQIQPASLDLRLGEKFLNPMDPTPQVCERESITLEPQGYILAETKERISLPDDIASQISGRSTLGRMFVTVHQTAGWLDPGWDGHVTLEIMNLSREIRTIEAGDRICQAIFFPLDRESRGYDGQYDGSGPELPGDL